MSFQHPSKMIICREAHDVLTLNFVKPIAIAPHFGLFLVEQLEDLGEIGFGVGVYFFARKRRARFRTARGVTNHGGKIADQENGGVAEVLKMLELAQHDGVAEMNIGGGG